MQWHALLAFAAGAITLFVVFYTPRWLAHYTWAYRVTRSYVLEGDTVVRNVTYDHRRCDGVLVHHRLATGRLPPPARTPAVPVCEWWCRVLLPPPGAVRESEFLRLVGHILSRSPHVAPCSAVLVARRSALRRFRTPGCFLRTTYVRTERGWGAQRVADAHRAAIADVLSQERMCDTVSQRIQLLQANYVFNKWMLDRIERSDGRVLRAVRGGQRINLGRLLRMEQPLEIKCVQEAKGVWCLLLSPLHAGIYGAVSCHDGVAAV